MKVLTIAALLLVMLPVAWSQERLQQDIIGVIVPRQQEESRVRLELSKSRGNYPVTPGDAYILKYRSAGEETSSEVLVEADYTVNLGVFGQVRAQGLSFPELKARVESIIGRAYPNSLPFLAIDSVGVFQVYLKGEVPRTQFVTAWGLSRLSEVIEDKLSAYSSLRDVRIVTQAGEEHRYDIYRALHEGAVEEDPFVRPGDAIVITRRPKEVEVKGHVFRPGKYQILESEGVESLLRRYGGGLTAQADPERITLVRTAKDDLRTVQLSLADSRTTSLSLADGDVVTVRPLSERMPAVIFEGAVSRSETPTTVISTDDAALGADEPYDHNRILHRFAPGDTLYDALHSVAAAIAPSANLEKAFVIRKGSPDPIPVDLESMLFDRSRVGDMELRPSDRIVIPSYRYYVTVVGAVAAPGSYQYVPRQPYAYYVSLAGGVPPESTQTNILITDATGKPRPLTAVIEAEDRIMITEERIAVAGGVHLPGSFAYVPGQKAPYYVGLAGGIDPELNADDTVRVTDAQGNPKEPDQAVRPGDRILIPKNDFFYSFNRYFPAITSVITLLTSMIALITVLSN